jgi:hypothetical protein
MRRLLGTLLTIATIATVVFTFVPDDAGASRPPGGHHPPAATGARTGADPDQHLCAALDRLIVFMRHTPKPSGLKTRAGRAVLADLLRQRPARVATDLDTVVHSFTVLRDHGRHALTKAQNQATSDALFRVAMYTATRCTKRNVRSFTTGLVQARISRLGRSTTTSTTP